MSDLAEVDHPNHWYLPPNTTPPSVRAATYGAVRERMERYRKAQVIHAHEPGVPCNSECESMP